MALVNPGTTPAEVKFYTIRPDGTTVGEATFTLGPRQRNDQLFNQLLPASANQVGGWGFIRSDQPLIGDVLFGTSSGSELANLPQQVSGQGFNPAAPAVAAAANPASTATAAGNTSAPAVNLVGSSWNGTVDWREKNIPYSFGVRLKFRPGGVCSNNTGQPCKWEQDGQTVTIKIGETKKSCPASGRLVVNGNAMTGKWDHYGGSKCYLIAPPRDIKLKRHGAKN
jgi:hypothetical protein